MRDLIEKAEKGNIFYGLSGDDVSEILEHAVFSDSRQEKRPIRVIMDPSRETIEKLLDKYPLTSWHIQTEQKERDYFISWIQKSCFRKEETWEEFVKKKSPLKVKDYREDWERIKGYFKRGYF